MYTMPFKLWFSALLLLTLQACVVTPHQPLQSFTQDERVTSGSLANGLNYYLVDDVFDDDYIHLSLLVDAGSVDEDGTVGVAHATEHMVFNANRYYPRGIKNHLTELGFEAGREFNAGTGYYFTEYRLSFHPDKISVNKALQLFNHMMFDASLTAKDWAFEQNIIFEELRQVASVSKNVSEANHRLLRADDSRERGQILGNHDHIANIELAQIRDYYQRHYHASNMTIMMAGAKNNSDVIEAIESVFGSRPTITPSARTYINYPLDDGLIKRKLQIEDDWIAESSLNFRVALPQQKDNPSLYLLDQILLKMLEEHAQASAEDDIYVISDFDYDAPERGILSFAYASDDNDEAAEKIYQEITRLKRHGLNQALLDFAKDMQRDTLAFDAANMANFNQKQWLDSLNYALVHKTGITHPASPQVINAINAITLEQVQKRLDQLLASGEQVLIYRAPKGQEVSLPSDQQIARWIAALENKDLNVFATISNNIASKRKIADQANYSKEQLKARLILTPEQPVNITTKGSLTEWHYENGNSVVHLNMPTSDDTLLGMYVGRRGAMVEEMPYWLVEEAFNGQKFAAPDLFVIEGWMKWKIAQDVQMWNSISSYETQTSFTVPPEKLEQALLAYAVHNQDFLLKKDDLDTIRQRRQEAEKHSSIINPHRYVGGDPYQRGSITADKLTLTDLEAAFNHTVHQPKTLFLIGKADPRELQKVTDIYLPSEQMFSPYTHYLPELQKGHFTNIAGDQQDSLDKAEVAIFTSAHFPWEPEQAYFANGVEWVARRAIANKLRGELGQTYSSYLEIFVTPETHQAELLLFFETDPANAEALAKLSVSILDNLEREFTEQDVAKFKQDIAEVTADINKMDDGKKLERLKQSYFARGDASFLLEDQPAAADRMSLSLLKETYHRVWNNPDVFISITKTE